MTRLGGTPDGVLFKPSHHRHGAVTAACPPVQRRQDVPRRPVMLASRQPVNRMGVLPCDFLLALPPAIDGMWHASAGLLPDRHMAPELPVSLHAPIYVL